jgi:hypothetical protein
MNLDVQQFAEALAKMIRVDMNNYADDLASNTCKTMEDYRHICGRLQGLADAEAHLYDLIKRTENADE